MTEQTGIYKLDKSVWTHDDFEEMGWHDAHIYGLIIELSENEGTADLLLDIDYIFKWINPVPPAKIFTFWIAPCTLIFKEVFDLQIDLKIEDYLDLMEISDLHLKSKVKYEKDVYEWLIDLHQGQINLKSCGFAQIVRRQPIHVSSQNLTLDKRGGINFGRQPFDEKANDK